MEDRLINFEFEELWYLFKKKFWIIIVITVITTSLAVLKVSKLQPSYSASAKVLWEMEMIYLIFTQKAN